MENDLKKCFDVPAVQSVMTVIACAGGEARFVGGCVRDALLGRPFRDFDLAVTLLPEQTMAVCQDAGFKVVPIGSDHGTVLVVNKGRPFELTTLRRDVKTDGRRATVAFTDDWEADASRRDFTMNAIYCDAAGQVTDYFGGVADARAGVVRFVGDADARIREDVLRILRFFRFHAHYGVGGVDEAALGACRDQVALLRGLSAERVSAELMKLLSAKNPLPAVQMMREIGVFDVLALPFICFDRLADVVALADTGASEDVLRLWAVVPDDFSFEILAQQLRLPGRILRRLLNLRSAFEDGTLAGRDAVSPEAVLREAYFRDVQAVRDVLILRGQGASVGVLDGWSRPRLPVRGGDVMALGKAAGVDVAGFETGRILKATEAWWVKQDFCPDRQSCLAYAQSLIA